jgi:hypothetical protein
VAIYAPGASQCPHRRLQQNPDHRWARPRLGSAAAAAHGDGSAKLVGAAVLGRARGDVRDGGLVAVGICLGIGGGDWSKSAGGQNGRRRACWGLLLRRRACWGLLLRRRHGWLAEEEVVPDAEMCWKGEPEIRGLRGGHSGGEELSGGSECPAAREVGVAALTEIGRNEGWESYYSSRSFRLGQIFAPPSSSIRIS